MDWCWPAFTWMITAATAAGAAPLPERQEVLSVERSWDRAIVTRDVNALDSILADDFLGIWIDGSVSRKADVLASVAKRKVEIDPFQTEDVVIRIYGDVAIVTGRFTQTLRLCERSETNSFRYTDTYRRTGGRWRALTAQATLVKH